jgi:hypothetical protein
MIHADRAARPPRAGTWPRRSGASLALALAMLVLIECVVVGTLHLAMLERQLASSAAAVLRLRLAAEAALADASTMWPPAADSLVAGGSGIQLFDRRGRDGLRVTASLRCTVSGACIIRSTAAEPPAGNGAATAAMLVLPPLLPPLLDHAVLHARMGATEPDAAAHVHAVLLRLAAGQSRLRGRSGVVVMSMDADPGADSLPGAGVIFAAGDLRLPAGTRFTGAVFVDGTLTADAGAEVAGLVVARAVAGSGLLVQDAAAARAVISAAGLQRSDPVHGRSLVPSF